MDFVIVTGMSGAGKSRAVDALEDIGFYCIDNMPPKLISKFAEICLQSDGKISRVAIVTDVRGGELFQGLFDELDHLKDQEFSYKLMFLDASDAVLMRRYKETRRRHPLLDVVHGSIENALKSERLLLKPARERADYIIDTTHLSAAQLKERISNIFLDNVMTGMLINCTSFGFKYGPATEADLVFDVRCLPNPFYVDELKKQTGLDQPVRDYVMKWPQSIELLNKIVDLVDFLIPYYLDEGKSQLVIAFGCTGGKHRSVTFAEYLYKHLSDKGHKVTVNHRDILKN
ncbi:MAG: RNase adapter RapZ [Clostridiales bacterium]|nr:RNase adapter RapZ [Clostridiales bacterium]